jgi:putative transposase
LTKALAEVAVQAELTHHLGYEKLDPQGRGSGNSPNGTSKETLKGDFGEAVIEVPRGTLTAASSRRSCRRMNAGS